MNGSRGSFFFLNRGRQVEQGMMKPWEPGIIPFGKTPTPGVDFDIPEFPWPPPKASTSVVIPSDMIRKSPNAKLTMDDVVQKFSNALFACGYLEKSFYAVPDGFAIVTPLEQINIDGSPMTLPDRWAVEIAPLRKFSLSEYIKALLTARKGYYRIIVFIFTSTPFSQADTSLSHDEVQAWITGGFNILPPSISKKEYSQNHQCTALIYEFEQYESGKKPELKFPSRIPGGTHLVKAELWEVLKK